MPIRFPVGRDSGDTGPAAQVNRHGRPRFMSQPGIMLREQFDLTHPTSPVERTIVDALR